MFTDSTEYIPPRSTSHHELESRVWEKVLSLPSIALDASKLVPDPDMKVEDWFAVACRATLTPCEKTWTSNI
jgi:hypothetical protein